MSKKLYVGNLPYETVEQEVHEKFAEFGTIEQIDMIMDRDTGRFRGFCFVTMEDSAANAAIEGLNGVSFGGRELKVNEAKPREPRQNSYGGGGGGNRGGGGYNRGGGGSNRW